MTDPAARSLAAATRAVHAGERQQLPRRAAAAPIVQTAPFVFGSVAELAAGFASEALAGVYSRYHNPTVRVVEEKLAALEGTEDAVAFASGMAAISGALAASLRSGDLLLAARELYGGTHSWLGWLSEHHPEIATEILPLAELGPRLSDPGRPAPRLVFVETPTNPLLDCCDLTQLAATCRRRDALLVVDNTFATPVLQNPLGLGADLVVHSATKYLGGHSDVTAGLVAGRAALLAPVRRLARVGGACLDPHAAFLLARGMKTLALRIERQSATAARLAEWLRGQPVVRQVWYPGWHPLGRAQMRAGGGMLACDLGGAAAAERALDRLQVFQLIPSLGGVESGVSVPALTSHRQLSPSERQAQGIGDGLVRLSCGIEDPDDLEADLEQALAG
ncbi:MAG TPA: PLP-dependent aspartate aminotransferase family protein [Thermoanaerobaculia bacterium]|nr:PLP-dependent aspartate aminotransferase family protein [Thermoanaerobaculia bacterium]